MYAIRSYYEVALVDHGDDPDLGNGRVHGIDLGQDAARDIDRVGIGLLADGHSYNFV